MAGRGSTLTLTINGNANQAVRALNQVSSGTQSMASKLRSGLTSALKPIAAGTVAVGIAAIGTALTKGFSRLVQIDQARAKLTGLGHDAASVDKIMDNALAAVRGTAYGLGDAATVAASAVAAGIQPGAQLERTLKLVADAAAISGRSMTDMGAIFNKVAASNKVQMDVINQLHDAGVPALSLLAKQLGVTSAEASKMASAGKIDFATFQAAMEAGLGGAALKSGQTFTGAMANVGAALGRIGANLEQGIFVKLAPLLQSITTALGPVEDVATRVGDALANKVGPVIDRITEAANKLDLAEIFDKISQAASGLGPVIAPLAAAFAALGGSSIAGALGPLGPLFSAIVPGPLVAAIIALVAALPGLRKAIGPVLGVLAQLGKELGGQLMDILKAVMPSIQDLADTLGKALVDAAKDAQPLISAVIEVGGTILKDVLPPVVDFAAQLADFLAPALDVIGDAIGLLAPLLKKLSPVIGPIVVAYGVWTIAQWALNSALLANPITWIVIAVIALVAAIIYVATKTKFFQTVWGAVWGAIKTGIKAVSTFFKTAWNAVFNAVKSFINGVKTTFTNVFNAIKTAVRAVGNFFKSVWSGAVSGVRAIVSGLRGAFTAVMNGIRAAVRAVANFFKSAWSGAVNGVKSIINGIKTTFSNVFNAVKNAITSVGSKISSGLSGPINTVKRIVAGLSLSKPFDAVRGVIDKVVSAVKSLISWLGKIKVPKISLPKIPGVGRALPLTPSAAGWTSPTLTRGPGLSRAGTADLASSGDVGQITVVINLDGQEIGRFTQKQVDSAIARQARRVTLRAAV